MAVDVEPSEKNIAIMEPFLLLKTLFKSCLNTCIEVNFHTLPVENSSTSSVLVMTDTGEIIILPCDGKFT